MNKHTPGPWVTTPEPNGKEWGVDAGPWGICICADAPGKGTAEDNARLIAAAPDLLDALKQIKSNANMYHAETISEIARAAIAKATGDNDDYV